MQVSVFPAVKQINGSESMTKEGIFSTFTFSTAKAKVSAEIEKKSNSEWSITAVKSTNPVNDIFMYVDYIGNMGKLFVQVSRFAAVISHSKL